MKTSLTLYMIALIAFFFLSNSILNYESNFLIIIKRKVFKKKINEVFNVNIDENVAQFLFIYDINDFI